MYERVIEAIEKGELHHDDEKCFWTDTYYYTSKEMEQLYPQYGVAVIDHFAQDGATPYFSEKVDKWRTSCPLVPCGNCRIDVKSEMKNAKR